jgi:hypothetical protein
VGRLEKQIPRRLKPARDDNNKGLQSAHLKVRPFKKTAASAGVNLVVAQV